MADVEVFEENDEISLFDLWEKLRKGWRYVAGGAAIGLLCAGLAIMIIKPMYEASAILQSGKIAGSVVEDPVTMLERLRAPSFQLEVAQDVGDEDWAEAINARGGNKVMSASIPKANPSVIAITIQARSPAAAREIADTATSKLTKRQGEVADQVLKKIRFDIDITKEKLTAAERDLEKLSVAVASSAMRDERFSQLSLMTALKTQKDSETFSLRQSVFSMENSLLPPATQEAKLLEPIFAPEKAVSPKKGLILVLGVLGGLLLGVMWVFVSDAWRFAAERRATV